MAKVLVVEDSIMVAKALKILLASENIEVIHTDDGRKAVPIIKTEGIDLVVLDFMMPNFSGGDTLKTIREDPGVKDTPVLMLTAKTDAMKWDKDLAACDKFMTKPFDNNELIAEIKKLLQK